MNDCVAKLIPRRERALRRSRRWAVRVVAVVAVPVRVLRAVEAPRVAPAQVRPARVGVRPERERDPEPVPPGPVRARVQVQPVPAGATTLRAPLPR
jgi:hypothetical protein